MASATIVQLTDLHLFADEAGALKGVRTWESFQAALRDAKRMFPRPDLLLLTGDLAQDERAGTYARLAESVAGWARHVRVSPGNHCDERALFSTLFPRLGIPPLAQDEGLMLGGWRILALNTHDPAASPGGRLGKRELARLEEALADARGKPVLIAMHHPPVPVGTPWLDAMGLEDAEQFWEIAKRHAELRAVVFGHAHQALALERGGVRLFGTPSTCIQFAQGSERITFSVEPIGWRWIRLNDDGTMHTRVRRVAAAPLPMPSDQEPY